MEVEYLALGQRAWFRDVVLASSTDFLHYTLPEPHLAWIQSQVDGRHYIRNFTLEVETGFGVCLQEGEKVEVRIIADSTEWTVGPGSDGCLPIKLGHELEMVGEGRRWLVNVQEDENVLLYVALGSFLTLVVLGLVGALYRCCCVSASPKTKPATTASSLPKPKPRVAIGEDVEMVPLTAVPTPPPVPLPVAPDHVASRFEAHFKLPAAAFEKHWSTGQVVDVWGCTIPGAVPLGEGINLPLIQLGLVKIASGCVNGVEKMYWVGMKRSTGGLGMIEVSVDLHSKRLSAVFKLSPPQSDYPLSDFASLFEAFKLAIAQYRTM
ncbi:hypothetical protein BASA81_013766 [Batrachochytrium salamandrivorans]|nr:hypothetical protein BASA81_013766 [Batrachochytrium salamandrivorans]